MKLAMDHWRADTAVLSDLRTSWTDKLDVVGGRLKLEKGKDLNNFGTAIVRRPSVVADHLEGLIKNTAKECFQSIQQSRSERPEFYEQVADFKREFKCLYKRLCELWWTFRSLDVDNAQYAKRYSQLRELASAFFKQIKEYKSGLTKPLLNERPIKLINYDERSEYVNFNWKYPQRVPIGETVAAAKKAFLLAQPRPEPLYVKCIKVIGSGVLFWPAAIVMGMLTTLKIVFWNPLEWLIRGAVRTISPLDWYLKHTSTRNSHMDAYQGFTKQLLHCPVITVEVVEAFKQLAPHADMLDLGWAVLASKDIRELAPFIEEDKRPGAIPLVTYLDTMKQLCEKKNIQIQTLYSLSHRYRSDNDVYLLRKLKEDLSIADFLEDVSNRMNNWGYLGGQAHTAHPYITPKALQKLLETASSSPSCRVIALSESLAKLKSVADFLNKHSYRLKKEGLFQIKIYRR